MDDPEKARPKPPSLVPGVVLLAIAAVLIVVVLADPPLPGWARTTVAVIAIVVVLALLGYAVIVFRGASKRGSGR